MKQKLILIGGGGHCISSIDVIESTAMYDIVGILDVPDKVGQQVMGYKIIGIDADLKSFIKEDVKFIVTIGQIKDPQPRIKALENLLKNNARITSIFSKNSIVSEHSKIGMGTMVFHNAVVNAGVVIGKNSIINTGSIVEHECLIGDHTQVSTRAIVNGQCKIGNKCFIGSNTTINNNLSICDDVIVASGSTVIQNIEKAGIYAGNPVKKVR